MFDDLIDKTDSKELLTLEAIIAEGLSTFSAVGSALLQIRDAKLYHPQYGSFEDYCRERWDIEHSHAYRLMDSAKVMANLKGSPIGELLPANEAQARPLASLPPEQQPEAWSKAVESAPKGKKPSAGLVRRIVDRIRTKAGQEKSMTKLSKGWTTEELKDDVELFEAFKAIAAVYGNEDTKLIRTGIVQMKRADILYLAKLPKEKMLEIHELLFADRWRPQDAVRFLSRMPKETHPIATLLNLCLSTKDKFWTGDFGTFTITVRKNRAAKR